MKIFLHLKFPHFCDQHCEELAYSHLFQMAKFGYKVKREIPISAWKYFSQTIKLFGNI